MWGDEVSNVEQTLFSKDAYYYQRNSQLAADLTTSIFGSIDRTADKVEDAYKDVAEAQKLLERIQYAMTCDKINSEAARLINKVLAYTLINGERLAYIPANNEQEMLRCVESIMWNNKSELEKSLSTSIETQEFQSWVKVIESYSDAIPILTSMFHGIQESYKEDQLHLYKDLRNKCVEKAMEVNTSCDDVHEPPTFS